MHMELFEQELFRQCKEHDKDAHANSGKLLKNALKTLDS